MKKIVFPIHPRARNRIEEYGFKRIYKASNIKIIKPLGYIEFLKLMANAKKVVTNSDGVQKRGFLHG